VPGLAGPPAEPSPDGTSAPANLLINHFVGFIVKRECSPDRPKVPLSHGLAENHEVIAARLIVACGEMIVPHGHHGHEGRVFGGEPLYNTTNPEPAFRPAPS